jgi:hypothetical protein
MHRSDTTEGINYRVTIRAKFADGQSRALANLDRGPVTGRASRRSRISGISGI